MSWSLSVYQIAREDFAAAVDAAPVSGQSEAVCGEDVARAKEALKALAACVKRPILTASASGHSLTPEQYEEGPGMNWYDGVTLTLSGSMHGPAI